MSRMRRARTVVVLGALLLGGCAQPPSGAPEPVPPVKPGEQPAAASFTVVAGGDVLIHPALTEQAEQDGDGKRDFTKIFAGVKPAVEAADLAVCHLEVPLATKDGPFEGYPLFSAPPEVATALAETGYDTCSTASNHTFDHGADGITHTLDALDGAGIGHTGSARTEQEAATPLVRDVAGVKVGQVSFTFGFNQGAGPPEPWMGNVLDPEAVLTAARAARDAGAEVVIASLHWGIEDHHEVTDDQRSIARQLLADPAIDLIIGHHAHVVQPFEKVEGKWVAYGLGNQVARHEEPRGTTEEGVMARFRFTRGAQGWTVDRAEYLPTLTDLGPPIRLRDLTTDPDVDPTRKQEALTRTDEVIRSENAPAAGLTRP
jgi:poly-gamma-glutamate capsule biosynthesis protein CapA/YwtB (metallophosphatase superfamily)